VKEFRITIVGAGPMGTYALERLAALLGARRPAAAVRVSIFEQTGRFGAGAAHSDLQSRTSYMNRPAGQITFASDESNAGAGALLPAPLRPTFLEWCRGLYALTGAPEFDLQAADVPRRYVHGLALREMFERYVGLLRALPSVCVDLYPCEVTDVSAEAARDWPYEVRARGLPAPVPADRVLFVTGHSPSRPRPGTLEAELTAFGASTARARYLWSTYPLEVELTEDRVPSGSVVGVRGFGLTAIDIFLHLTEGRGGAFLSQGPSAASELRYLPSGREPASIVAISPSGMPVLSRPLNAKQPADAHRGLFCTASAIRSLRRHLGVPRRLEDGSVVRQLDFGAHVFPLVVLEMACLYYRTLLGRRLGEYSAAQARPRYLEFLRTAGPGGEESVDYLLEPVQECFDQAVRYCAALDEDRPVAAALQHLSSMAVVPAFLHTVLGPAVTLSLPEGSDQGLLRAVRRGRFPPAWGHSLRLSDHRFDWRAVFHPLGEGDAGSGAGWRLKLIDLMRKDIAASAQNNLESPIKAACDGVWRDLRAVLSATVDRGGLLPSSHRAFLSEHMRYYNRLSNGAGLEAMRKVLALVEAGLLDVSIGPSPRIHPDRARDCFQVEGGLTGVTVDVEVLVEARIQPFDPELEASPLYPNLLARGLIRKWRNVDPDGAGDFVPGGLDLTEDFHPLRADGSVDANLTFIGAPAEGPFSFQTSAARPYVNSYILNNVARWADQVVEAAGPIPTEAAAGGDRAAEARVPRP
jgi:uncharacterized NAD(P)/FAD-binding protein YdhS